MDVNRHTAYETLLDIEKNKAFSNISLNHNIMTFNPNAPSFVRELVYGVLENKIYLDFVLSKLITKGLKGVKKQDLCLLRMGIYQLEFMNSVPEYAAVNETVLIAKKKCRGREGFINGVLRGYKKKRDSIKFPNSENNTIMYLSIKYSYSKWIVELWMKQFGREFCEELLKVGNRTPKLTIRVNLLKTSKEELINTLREKGFSVSECELSNRALYVKGSGLLDIDEYSNGLFSIQDLASIYATDCIEPTEGQTILDICAAPGGKTMAMAELMNNQGKIFAFDVYPHKLELLNENCNRLGITNVETKVNDGTLLNSSFKECADRVFVDGPCTGLGVIGKKPEIKYKNIEDEGKSLGEKQFQILEISSQYVKAGGVLLYSTCTINENENKNVVEKFLGNHSDFEKIFEKQLFPNIDETDGFYICKLTRKGRMT